MASFGAAVAAGFPAIEMDLRLTRDGHVVVLHDATVDRTTDGKGRISHLDWKEVAGLDTRDGPVPRLDDLMASLRAWDGLWNLEVKAPAALVGVLELAARHGLDSRSLVSAMDPEVLEEAQALAPHVPRGFIALGPIEEDDLDAARSAGARWINADHDYLDADEAARILGAGFRLGAYTINRADRAKELAALGVECVITDDEAVLAALGKPLAAW